MIYLASPYSHETTSTRFIRHRYACQAAARIIVEGFEIYSPIAMTHAIHEWSYKHPCKHIARLHNKRPDFWYKFDETMMDRCARLVILGIDGWKESEGIAHEYQYFRKKELPWTIVSWQQIVDDKPLFLQWYGDANIDEVANKIGV